MSDIPTRIRRVELRCSNVGASAEFYSRLLGLEPSELGQERALLGVPGQERPMLALTRAEQPGPAPQRAAGLFHTAFRYADRAGLAAALRRIATELGINLTGVADHGVSEALYLDDPDGLGIEIYRDRSVDEWPQPEEGERIRMFTEPLDLNDLIRSDDGTRASVSVERGLDIGHVHLKVADTDAATGFWTGTIGMELMTRFGADAAFLASDGYHHHIGANSWFSAGADLEPAGGPGLEAIAISAGPGGEATTTVTPDGVPIQIEAD